MKTSLKLIFTAILLIAVIFCVWHVSNHDNGASVSPEHIAIWQKPLSLQINVIALSFLLLLALGTRYPILDSLKVRYWLPDSKRLSIIDYLKLAFSEGILNPKVY